MDTRHMTNDSSTISREDINLITYNAGCNASFQPIIKLLTAKKADVLAVQEPHQELLDPTSRKHKQFLRALPSKDFQVHVSTTNLTIISPYKLGPYVGQAQSSLNGRVLVTPLEVTPDYTILIANIYGCQRSNKDHIKVNTEIMHYLDTLHDDWKNRTYHIIPMGDLNTDPIRDQNRTDNLLNYLIRKFEVYSSIHHIYTRRTEDEDHCSPIPPTYEDTNNGKSCIDHICLPLRLLPPSTKSQNKYFPRILRKLKWNKSYHHPVLQLLTIPLYQFKAHANTDLPPPIYSALTNIPLKPGPDPDSLDDNNTDWFQPDESLIPASKLASKCLLLEKAHTLQKTSPRLQQLLQHTKSAMDQIEEIIRQHTSTSSTLIPRTIQLQNLLTDALNHIENGIDTTMGLLDLFPDPPAVKKQNKQTITDNLALKQEWILTTINKLKSSARARRDRKIPVQMYTLLTHVQSYSKLLLKIENKLKQNLTDYDTMVQLRLQRAEAKKAKGKSASKKAAPKNPPPKYTTASDYKNLVSMDPKQKTSNPSIEFTRTHTKFCKYVTVTREIADMVAHTIEQHLLSMDDTPSISQALAFVTLIHDNQIQRLRHRTSHIHHNYDNMIIDFHSQFGDTAIPAHLINPKNHSPPAANKTIPTYIDPLSEPQLIPAIGPAQQKEATRATQQRQADPPPGKALHFVNIINDEVGPHTIEYTPDKTFTAADLNTYHPHSHQFPPAVQQEIIQAHALFLQITETLKDKHKDNITKPATQWPFKATIAQCTITNTQILHYHNSPETMKPKLPYVPSTARLHGFTLNVLARLHPCWMRSLDRLTNLILVTRILPKSLKTTGRVLIDKPNTTDKRPISILHAYDSYIDTIVATHLAKAVEDLQIYDDTIAAYRPGHSCSDCTLNHLLAIQDTISRDDYYLCQLDEDKEKFFDRITTELQLLPLHLMGFPNDGYIEWIAESLNNVAILTATPFGSVETTFECGVRQGSALSCVIANAVAWLSAAPWTMDLDNAPPPGHQPAQLHPFDITHNNSGMLHKFSYCDDSSAYITSTDIQQLFEFIARDIVMSNTISIVTKLSINAKKSHIRITNLPSRYPIPSFHYISWHHGTKTVQAKRIPTSNMTDKRLTDSFRLFGTHSNGKGHTQENQRQHFPKMHAARASFKNLHLQPATFTTQFPALVTSTVNFNVLAMSYNLEAAIKDDYITIYKYAAQIFGLHPAADSMYSMFLPTTALGHNFTGILTLQLAIAIARELFVTLNAPHPQQTSLLQVRARAMLHNLTITASTYDPLDILPHALHQLALLGIYLVPTTYPIANQALAQLIQHDISTTAIGTPKQQPNGTRSPLDNLLNGTNIKYTSIDPIYRSLLVTIYSLANTMNTPYHRSETFTEIFQAHTMPTPVHNPNHPPQTRVTAVRVAAIELQPQYNHLSHFLHLDFLSQRRHLNKPENFLNNNPLYPSTFRLHSLFPAHDNAQTNWPNSPIPSLHTFHERNSLPLAHESSTFSHVQHVLDHYNSPLLLSSDAGHCRRSGFTVAASILMALLTDPDNADEPVKYNEPPIPIIVRNHILAQTYGTKTTDNNMGEAQGLILSLYMAPTDIHTIFLLDSKVVLLQLLAYFHPHAATIRHHLRTHIHTTSIHHYSELHQAIARHWPNANHRPSSASRAKSPFLVHRHFHLLLQHLHDALGPDAILHLTPDADSNVTTLSEATHGFQIGHHLFLHIHSHQLTNYGKRKRHPDTNQPIDPIPNMAFATANTWVDRSASRMAATLPTDLPQIILDHIPHPPMTRLQYTYMHESKLVNTDHTTYLKEQWTKHNMELAALRQDHWYLHLLPSFADPTKTFNTDSTLRNLAQERALSHQRLLRINLTYRKYFQAKCHPCQQDLPRNTISTQMQLCPLCSVTSTPATSLHYHLQCTFPKIALTRNKCTRKIEKILLDLDAITSYMSTIIYPNHRYRHNRIPPFTTFLRTSINHTDIITTLTPSQRQTYYSTAVYPPFQNITYDEVPDWNRHALTSPPNRLTIAHTSNLLGLPETDLPAYPTNHFHVIPLLGLLPTNTHIAIHEYLNMIHHKFCLAIRARSPQVSPAPNAKVTIEYIQQHLSADQETSILTTLSATKTLLEILQDNLLLLIHSLIKKAKNLQGTISAALRENQRKHVPPSPPSTKPPKRKLIHEQITCDTDDAQPHTKKRKRTIPNKLPTYPCPGRWCTLRKSKSLSYTMSTIKRNCTLCQHIQLATTIATTITAHIICDEAALSLLLEYTNMDPQQFTVGTIATRLALRQIPLDEIRDILSNVISHTETKLYISDKLTFLPIGDALYETPDAQLQELVLHLVAYACLIPITPPLTREFPSLTPERIQDIIERALVFCTCPTPCPAPNLHTNLCTLCSNLISNDRTSITRQQAQHSSTCLTCDRATLFVKYPNKPCDICITTATLVQRNPRETWNTINKATSPSVLPHLLPTPYAYIHNVPRIRPSPYLSPLPPEQIYQTRDPRHPRPQLKPNEDPDFHYQDCYEEESFLDMKIFPPRPPFMPFPRVYAHIAITTDITITNLHLALHPALYRPDYAGLHLHYKRPCFPRFEGIRPPTYGYYPEMYFDQNVQALARAMPSLDIHEVEDTMVHPNPSYVTNTPWYHHTTVTWTFLEHPQPRTKCPNEHIYKTPVTFILTFYPPMIYLPPFQIRLHFNPNDMERDLPLPDNILTSDIAIKELDKNEDPTLYALMLIYLIVTLPPQFLSDDTVSDFMLTFPENLRQLHHESSYLHAILHDENYSQALHHITTPWKITYNKQDDEYSDHPNDRPRRHNPDNPNH